MILPFQKLAAVLLFALLAGAQVDGQQINNLEKWAESGFDEISSFGPSATTTYGQTFRLPASYDQITSFTFQLRALGGGDVRFSPFLSEWDEAGGKLTGPLLYSGAPETLLSSSTVFGAFTFSLPPLVLDAAKIYVAFISTSHLSFDGAAGTAAMGSPNYGYSDGIGQAFTGGRFVYFNNDEFSLLYTSKWEGIEASDDRRDAAFVTNFSRSSELVPVPEPATYGLFAILSLAGLIAVRRLRSHTAI